MTRDYEALRPRLRSAAVRLSRLCIRAFVGARILLQLLNASFGGEGNIGWMVHVGGIAAGLVLTPIFKRRKHPLLNVGAGNKPGLSSPPQEAPPPEETNSEL